MIKCPGCGRTYSNLVKVCPACKTVLNSQSQELPKYESKEKSNTVNSRYGNASVICPNCGAVVQDGAKFCGACGSRIVRNESTTVNNTNPTTPVVPASSISNQYQQNNTSFNQSSQSLGTEDNIFIQYFKDITSFNFNGRMNRAKYWKFAFIGLGCLIVLGACLGLLGIVSDTFYSLIGFIYTILTLPFTVRRFHDLNKSGWWTVLCLIPLVCIIPNIYIGFFKGTDGPNKYGPDPLQYI